MSNWVRVAHSDEYCVKFGLKLCGETGVIVARGTAEVNSVVKLTWQNTGAGRA